MADRNRTFCTMRKSCRHLHLLDFKLVIVMVDDDSMWKLPLLYFLCPFCERV
jgi:hypothetical protein